MSPPFFTVIVPTRDRAVTLPHSVRSILAQQFGDLEAIVVDNCSAPPAAESLTGLDDPRLRIVTAPRRLAMHDNWEFGLSQARGRHVMFIGDDDAVMPDGLELAARILRDNPAEVLAWPRHDYKWPDSTLYPGLMVVRQGERLGPYDGPAHLAALFGWRQQARFVTSIYHGLVSADLIARIRQAQGGRYFADPVCDIESEMLNAYYASRILACERPLTMNGHSGASNGGANGEAATIRAAHSRFAAEAGLAEADLVPYGWDFPLYMPTMIAGCQARVKARHFPQDDRFAPDMAALLQHLANTYFVFGEAAFDELTARLRRIAIAQGIDPGSVKLPPPDRRKVQMGFATGIRPGEDGTHSVVIDSRKAGVDTISKAVQLADAMMPAIAEAAKPPPAGPT